MLKQKDNIYYLSGKVTLFMFHRPTGWRERRMKLTLPATLFMYPFPHNSADSIPYSTPDLAVEGDGLTPLIH